MLQIMIQNVANYDTKCCKLCRSEKMLQRNVALFFK